MIKKHVYLSTFVAICLGAISTPSTADVSHNYNKMITQSIDMRGTGDLLKNAYMFKRLNGVKIIETTPHLKKENQAIRLSSTELVSVLKQAGFRGESLKWAWAVAMQESTARPYAFNKSSNCYGLFQINMTGSMGPDRREKFGLESNNELFDPLTNAKIAYHMSSKGTNWSAWVNHKAIKRWLSQYPD